LQGEPTGIKIVQMGNWTGKAYLIPKAQLNSKSLADRSDLKSQCIYFLLGYDSKDNQTVYVGEAESFIDRLLQHQIKEYCNYAISFISKDDNLTKAHVKYLESVFVEKIKNAGRIILQNTTSPTRSRLPEEDIADMEDFKDNIDFVLSTLGYTFTEEVVAKENREELSDQMLYLKASWVETKGVITNEGFVILEGSMVTNNPANSVGKMVLERYKLELELGNLQIETNSKGQSYYRVKKDILLKSPSMAARFATGYSVNGLDKWKNKNGETLGMTNS
jgi:hypothetical protein